MTINGNIKIESAVVHRIGNAGKGELLDLSEHELTLNDEDIQRILIRYFLSPFNEDDLYQFGHISSLELNEVFTYVRNIFLSEKALFENSISLAKFLYSKSTDVKIKGGDLYVAHFRNILFQGAEREAIGIFKSENKETFLRLFPSGKSWELTAEDGINIHKLDKGCLVFNCEEENGYRVCVIDNVNKQNDARYWVKDFLQILPISDDFHNTDNAMGMCKLFINNEMAEKFEVGKGDQIDMLNRSMDYFRNNDKFSMEEFKEEVIHHEQVKEAFGEYQKKYEEARAIKIEEEFDIHLSAVKNQEKKFKSILKLDKNFSIYIHGRKDLMERGFDSEKNKNFYTFYYDEES